MAMQAGLGASKLLILVGAGVGGSIVLRNSKLSDLLSDLSRVLTKHLKDDGDGGYSGGEGGDSTSAIAAQVRRLTMELRQLAAANRPITVVNGSPAQGAVANLGALALPAAVVGVAGYGYMWLKGWSLSDVMYVTRRNMSNAVASVSKQLEIVSTSLATTRKHLTQRLEYMSRDLDHNTKVTNAIQDQVGMVRGEVAQVGLEMKDVNKHIEGLEGKLDDVVEKQDFANQGIVLLCRFVLQGLEGGSRPELLQGFHAYSRTRLERASSTPFLATSGLKELQSFSERLLVGTGNGISSNNAASANDSPHLQRSLTTNVLSYVPRSTSKA